MRRVSTSTAAPNLHGVGKPGFTGGNAPAGIFPTEIGAEFCNGVQEELVGCIESSGQTLDVEDNLQVAKAIPYLAGHQIDAGADDLIFAWQSEHTPTVANCHYQRKTDTATTSSDLAAVMCFFTPPDASYGQLRYTITAVKVGESGTGQAKTVVVRFYKVAGVTHADSDFQVVEEAVPIGTLGFDYALSTLGGSVALSFKPHVGEDPDQNYNILVVGEMFCVKS